MWRRFLMKICFCISNIVNLNGPFVAIDRTTEHHRFSIAYTHQIHDHTIDCTVIEVVHTILHTLFNLGPALASKHRSPWKVRLAVKFYCSWWSWWMIVRVGMKIGEEKNNNKQQQLNELIALTRILLDTIQSMVCYCVEWRSYNSESFTHINALGLTV